MRLNDRELGLLRCIAIGPRTLHSFTHGPAPCAPHVIKVYLDRQVEAGFIEAPLRADGPYTIAAEGLEFLANRPAVVPPKTYGSMSTAGAYKPPTWHVRAGSDHRHPSRGMPT
jgi:hypothetical protein